MSALLVPFRGFLILVIKNSILKMKRRLLLAETLRYLRVSENGSFASESEWKKLREEDFEGSEWVLLSFHLSILDSSRELV